MADVVLQGQVLLPGGGTVKAGSKIVLKLSANGTVGGNKIIGRQLIEIPDGGLLTGAGITLTPNTDITPANTTYEAQYLLLDAFGNIHPFVETWDVDATDPVNVGSLG